MRRAPLVISATVVGMVAVLSFKPREPSAVSATATPSPDPASGSRSGSSGSSGGTSRTVGGTRTVTGNAIATRYGDAQVKVTIRDGRITAVQALQLQGNDPKSVQISGQAEPVLQQEVLAKQSAAIDTVSGATITSTSYEASLQSALDRAGFRAADGSRGTTTVPDVPEGHDDRGGWDGGGGAPPGFAPPQG